MNSNDWVESLKADAEIAGKLGITRDELGELIDHAAEDLLPQVRDHARSQLSIGLLILVRMCDTIVQLAEDKDHFKLVMMLIAHIFALFFGPEDLALIGKTLNDRADQLGYHRYDAKMLRAAAEAITFSIEAGPHER